MRQSASVAKGIGVAPRLGVAPRFGVALVFGVVLSTVLNACSADDDDAGRSDADGPTATAVAGDPAGGAGGSDSADPVPSESLAAVPEAGVPGLDSDDVVCRAWSRFGGSFQVLAVASSSYGSGDPVAVAALEVIASPTVTRAYDDLIANWPEELADEAAAVADDYLGPFARRADRALAELEAAGADATAIEAIVAAWEAVLAGRDATEPDAFVQLPDDVRAVVDDAAAELAAQTQPIPSDESLVTDVQVPLTLQYFKDNCPDQGTLGGVEG